jgi:hypothetical protein
MKSVTLIMQKKTNIEGMMEINDMESLREA